MAKKIKDELDILNDIDINKSLLELCNNLDIKSNFDSYIVKTCETAVKKSLKELTNEEIRCLISQKIGLKYTIPLALNVLNENILVDCQYYNDDLLNAILELTENDWDFNQILLIKFVNIIKKSNKELKNLNDENNKEYNIELYNKVQNYLNNYNLNINSLNDIFEKLKEQYKIEWINNSKETFYLYFSDNGNKYRLYVDESYIGIEKYMKSKLFLNEYWGYLGHEHYVGSNFFGLYELIVLCIKDILKTNIMNINKICEELIIVLPEEKEKLQRNIEENDNELLGHIYFGDEFNNSLIELLKDYTELDKIKKYCNFIEYMWKNGNEEVLNIVDVTILERLSDDNDIWNKFGKNISKEFKKYINKELIPNNVMMNNVNKL